MRRSLEEAGTHCVRISVTDTGIGIDPSATHKLFVPFSQLSESDSSGHVRRQTAGGTGLGLVICQRIVEAMQGRIGMESAGVGRGTTFFIEIDLREAHVEQSLTASRSSAAVLQLLPATTVEKEGVARKPRILVAEDNAINALLVTRMLEMHGYSPVSECACVCVCTYTYTRVYICMCTFVYMCVHVCVRVSVFE